MGGDSGQDTDEERIDSEEAIADSTTTETEPSTQMAYEEPEDEDLDENEDAGEEGVITMYLPENADMYKEAVIVVVLSVLACAVIVGALILLKK